MTAIAAPRVATATVPRTRHGWWIGATAVIWGTSLFVAALWVTGGGVTDLGGGVSAALDSLGRLTGLVASNLLLYQVLLMARVPLFERGFGRDGITRMHRLVGFWSLWLMLGHIVLITVGYALPTNTNVIAQFVDLTLTYPAMLLALAGTVAIIAVAVTSMRAARRRLRYESWHLLHLYAYIGVGLALPHQLWTGADFLSSPLATSYWWTLWALAAVALVGFRIVLPVVRNARLGLRVASVERSGTDAVSVTVASSTGRRVPGTSGQFFVWRFAGAGFTRGTPASAEILADGRARFTVRVVGAKTARIASLTPGTRVWVEGPFGLLTAAQRTTTDLVLFGAGSGVAPLVAILDDTRLTPGRTVLVTRDHTAGSAIMPARVDALVRAHGIVHFALEGPRSHGESSWIPAAFEHFDGAAMLAHLAPRLRDADVFVVGPPAWSKPLLRDLRAAGVPATRIHTESFTV